MSNVMGYGGGQGLGHYSKAPVAVVILVYSVIAKQVLYALDNARASLDNNEKIT